MPTQVSAHTDTVDRIERGGTTRHPRQHTRHEFFDDSASSVSSASSSPSDAADVTSRPTVPVMVGGERAHRVGCDVNTADEAQTGWEAVRLAQRQKGLAALATAVRGPANAPPRPAMPLRCARLPPTALGGPSTGPTPKSLSTVLVEAGRGAMEREVLHWRERCGALEAALVKAVTELDNARTALEAHERAPPPATAAAPTAAPRDATLASAADKAVLAEAKRWRAMANTFLVPPHHPRHTAPPPGATPDKTPVTVTASDAVRDAPTSLSNAPVVALSAPPAVKTARAHSPADHESPGRSRSPPTPEYHVSELLLSASSPPLAPPPALPQPVAVLSSTTTPILTSTGDASHRLESPPPRSVPESDKDTERGPASDVAATKTPLPSEELVYDVHADMGATDEERLKATSALDAIRFSEGAVAPSVVRRPPAASAAAASSDTQSSRTDAAEALRRAEAELAALRLVRDDLETTLLCTQEQLAKLQEEATTREAQTVPALPSTVAGVTVDDVATLTSRLRAAAATTLGEDLTGDVVDSVAGASAESTTISAATPATTEHWQTLQRCVSQLLEGVETQRVQWMETREELLVVREDRNELMGQQSEAVRRLQERLLAREQENVRLTERLAEHEATIAELTDAKQAAEDAVRAHSPEAYTSRIDALTSELNRTKHALDVKETALRIALRESIDSSQQHHSPSPSLVASPAPLAQQAVTASTQDSETTLANRTVSAPPPLRERRSPNMPSPTDAMTSHGARSSVSLDPTPKRASALLARLVQPSPSPGREYRADTAPHSGDGQDATRDLRESESTSCTSSTPGDGANRGVRRSREDVMARHRELWRQQEWLFGLGGSPNNSPH